MNSNSNPHSEHFKNLVIGLLKRELEYSEKKIIEGFVEEKTYAQIAEPTSYAEDTVKGHAGKLMDEIEEKLGVEIKKKTFKQVLDDYDKNKQASLKNDNTASRASQSKASLIEETAKKSESPEGIVPPDSNFYIKRHNNVESLCCKKIKRPGEILRLKSPQKMGKSSVLEQVLAELKVQGYKIARLSAETDRTILSSFYNFTRNMCVCVSKELGMDNQLDEHWEDDNYSCIDNVVSYLEEYLLPKHNNPLVIAWDDFDCVFEQSEIVNDVCRLLKTLYNLARRSGDRGAIFKKLRLVVVHSTDVYISLDINFSPLSGVGSVVTLNEFTRDEVIELTQCYKFNFVATEIEQLTNLVGGHPYLLRLALDHLSQGNSLEELLQIALKKDSPFRPHLQQLLEKLPQNSNLATAFLKVAKADEPVELKSNEEFKLECLGLVKMQGNGWIPSYNLYTQYILRQLAS